MIFRPKSFLAKLLLLFVPVIALAQVATWVRISRFNDRQAHRLIGEELARAAQTFRRVVDDRTTLLGNSARIAARDHQIKQLAAGDDRATLASALQSLRRATDSNLVAAVSPQGQSLASTTTTDPAEGLYAQLIALAEAETNPNLTATGYGYYDGVLHSVVLVPMQAGSETLAWLAVGFRIDGVFAEDLKRLTGIDLTFFTPTGKTLASTLPDGPAAELASAFPRLQSGPGPHRLPLGADTALGTLLSLQTGVRSTAHLALHYSLIEKLKPAREAERFLMQVAGSGLLLAVLLAIAFARHLTRPIVQLAAHTEKIAAGDYVTRLPRDRSDELGQLAGAMNDMSAGLEKGERVRDLLDKNVSPEIAEQLLRDGAILDGEEREVTILFADLRGFTTLSEQLSARDMFKLLNRYLDRMSGAIEAQGGVIDKFIGDAIMALFGAPVTQGDAADRAVAAARGMERALVELNAEFAAEGRAPLAIGIGVNTAQVLAGLIGSQRRLNYSVIGDGVNVAARLESLTRTVDYRTNIIVSAATLRAARGDFPRRALGTVAVKGRAEPVEIFAVDP